MFFGPRPHYIVAFALLYAPVIPNSKFRGCNALINTYWNLYLSLSRASNILAVYWSILIGIYIKVYWRKLYWLSYWRLKIYWSIFAPVLFLTSNSEQLRDDRTWFCFIINYFITRFTGIMESEIKRLFQPSEETDGNEKPVNALTPFKGYTKEENKRTAYKFQ